MLGLGHPALVPWRGALRRRNFRLFFFGQLVSLTGTWIQTLAQAWLVLQLTRDPFWLGVVGAAQFLPVLVVGLFGGVIADALPKRATIVATQGAQLALALVLALLSFLGIVEVWHVLVVAALVGVVSAIDMPTRQSFVMEMVGRDDLTNAIGLNSASFNATRALGPAIGGLAIGVVGVAGCFALNALSFLAVIAGLLAMREDELVPPERPARPASPGEVLAQLAEGLRYVRATPVVLLAVAMVAFVSTVAMNFNVVIPALAETVLEVGPTGLGFLLASLGIGSFGSAIVLAFARRPRPGALVGGAIVVGLAELVVGLVRSYPLALAAMLPLGAGAIGMFVAANTSIQHVVPDRLRGRVLAVYTTLFAGSTPFGALLIGWVASTWGTEPAFLVAGTGALLAGLAGLVWMRRGGISIAPAPVSAGAPPRGS